MVSGTLALLKYLVIYMNVKQGSGPDRDEVLQNGEKFRPSIRPSVIWLFYPPYIQEV